MFSMAIFYVLEYNIKTFKVTIAGVFILIHNYKAIISDSSLTFFELKLKLN